jgi:Domain of unknown function (DUF5916)
MSHRIERNRLMKPLVVPALIAALVGSMSASASNSGETVFFLAGPAPSIAAARETGRPVARRPIQNDGFVSFRVIRVEKGPRLDGRLDDEVWREAPVITCFTMVVPRSGDQPSEATELRILIDGSFLYIGVLCRDREPERIAALSMAHDGDEIEEQGEDAVRVVLDPFQDRRNAYFFSVNPRGARSEGLATGEHSSLDWDGLWDARSAIGPDGWSAELAIPFRSISFKPGLACWGINVERVIARRQEIDRLSGARADGFFTNPAEAAPLEGLGQVRQGLGLTFKPYGLVGPSRDLLAGTPAGWTLEGGFDLYKNFTPNLVGAFSYNTDFAETEVDERQVNLTRFPLYFPEKRTFFLEGSEIFNFGTSRVSNGSGFAPFFSRRIGLFEGRPVPVSYGAKVFGKIGATNLQVLDVRTGTLDAFGLPAENFLVARVSQNVLAESRVGAIFTSGSPTGEPNSLAGFDLVYQTSRFLGDKNFLAGGWLVYNWNERIEGHHEGFGVKVDYPNDLWDIVTSFNSYGDALDPGVGFLPRPGVRVFSLSASYQPRPEKGLVGRLIRQFFYEASFSATWALDGKLETRRLFTAPLNAQTESGEHFEFNVVPTYDVLSEAWEIADGVVLAPHGYAFTNYAVQFETASHRSWGGRFEWAFGPFYSGHIDNIEAGFRFKLKGYALFDLDANFVRGRLPEGTFAENVYQLKADLSLSPRLGLMNYVQYDDVSNRLGYNVRFRWELAPGNIVYLVYTKNWERRWDPASRFYPLEERGVFKITLSIRP